MLVLAVDAASSTGLALGRPGEKPVSARLRLTGDRVVKAAELGATVRRIIRKHKVDRVFLEAPMKVPGRGTPAVMLMLNALADAVKCACLHERVSCTEVAVGTWRKHFTGRGTYGGGEGKRAVIARCEALGWDCGGNSDRADAMGLLDYALSTLSRSHQTVGGLFDGACP